MSGITVSQARITEVGRCIRILHERRRNPSLGCSLVDGLSDAIRELGDYKRQLKDEMQAHKARAVK